MPRARLTRSLLAVALALALAIPGVAGAQPGIAAHSAAKVAAGTFTPKTPSEVSAFKRLRAARARSFSAPVSAMAGDDTIPGIPLPSSPATGALSSTDSFDVYAVPLVAGQRFALRASIVPSSAACDAYLYPPGTTSISWDSNAEPVAGTWMDESSGTGLMNYTVPKTGTYYLAMMRYYGTMTYTLEWATVVPDEADDNIPGVVLPSSPVTGSLDWFQDSDDVYKITLGMGDVLSVEMTGPAGSDYDLQLYKPGSTSISGEPWDGTWSDSYPEYFTHTCRGAGTYYLSVRDYEGSGDYELKWSVTPGTPEADDTIPGQALPASPVRGSVNATSDPDDVYYVSLGYGESIIGTITAPPGSHFDASLYPPGTTNLIGKYPIDGACSLYGRTFIYTSWKAGTYFVDIGAWQGSGAYTFQWRKTRDVIDDDDIPGRPILPSPFTGYLNETSDYSDVYGVYLRAGQTILVNMTAAADTDYDLALFAPDPESSVDETAPVASSENWAYPEKLKYTAKQSGRYYLQAQGWEGAGPYVVTWSAGAISAATISAPSTSPYRGSVPITGKLTTSRGYAIPYKPVIIEAKPYGATVWKKIGVVGSAANGTFRATASPSRRTQYRARFAGGGGYLAVTSATRTITPKAYLTKPSAPTSVDVGEAFTSMGYLKPKHAAGLNTVEIDCYRFESGAWKLKKRVWAKNVDHRTYTKYSKKFSLPSAGKWKIVGSVVGDWKHAATRTSPRYVTVD